MYVDPQSHLDDGLHLPEIALRAALDDGHTRSKCHPIDMFPRFHIVQGAHDDVKAGKPINVEALLPDVRADGLDVDRGVECRGRASGDGRLWLFYVLLAEKELAVEVGEVDRIKIQQGDVPETSQDDVFHCVGFYQNLFTGGDGLGEDERSSQPMPPLPTIRTRVFRRCSGQSAPRMAVACVSRSAIECSNLSLTCLPNSSSIRYARVYDAFSIHNDDKRHVEQ
jgi:hypothetical protein